MQKTADQMGLPDVPRPFASVGNPESDVHINGEYLRRNPSWHVEHSPWKAENLRRMLQKHKLTPRSVCDVGCGVGEVLRQFQMKIDPGCVCCGYDVASAAISRARERANDRLHFELADFTAIETPRFDLLIMTEVLDHVEDYFRFLRGLRARAEWKLFSFSLDFSAESSLRPGVLSYWRDTLSHLHHFNQTMLLDVLRRTGYEVVDFEYAPWPYRPSHLAARLRNGIRGLVFRTNPDLAARLFIGYNLIVLAR